MVFSLIFAKLRLDRLFYGWYLDLKHKDDRDNESKSLKLRTRTLATLCFNLSSRSAKIRIITQAENAIFS